MSIIDNYKLEHPGSFDSWLRLNTSIANALDRIGVDFIVWENMSVSNCIYQESVLVELERFEAAILLRDNIHRCYDYNSSIISPFGN